ncbi:MAG: MATE family efflux transporter [Ruminococcaceae bacterium]|nr:MATE family efflux transporter [Oscillospiraceae bacterium]
MHSIRKKYIGDRSFYRRAMAVALPIMIQNGITHFVALLDNVMVGAIGEMQMGGVGVANQLLFVFNLAVFGAISGAGIFGAQFYGKGDHEGVKTTLRFKLIIGAILLAVGLLIFTTLDETLIRAYLQGEGTQQERQKMLGFAKNYLHIMLLGLLPFVLSQSYGGTLRESGRTVVPMVAGIAAMLTNLALNAILIFGAGLGVVGAAIATVISRFVELAIVVIWTHRNKEKCPFVVGLYHTMRIPGSMARKITKKAIPLMLNEAMWAGGMALLSLVYSTCALIVVPANAIVFTVADVFNVAFLAMGNAVGIMVGQLLGADRLDEAEDTDRKLIVFSMAICISIGLIMTLLSPYIPNIYSAQPADVRSLASQMLLILALCMPINGLACACYFTMRSGGKTMITFLFDSVYICFFTVPLAAFLRFGLGFSILPLFLVCQLADLGKCIVGLILIKKGVWIQNIVKEEDG